MKDFTEGEMDEDEDEKELSEHVDAVGERGGDEGEGGEKQGKELMLAFELRSIAMSSSSSTLVC